jgi:hypothetical protein
MAEGHGELRAKLSRLINDVPDDVVGEERVAAWLHLQIQKISELSTKYAHGISVEVPWDKEITGLNCYMHALGLSPDAISEWRWPDINLDTPFVSSLLGTILVEKPLEEATNGDIVLYFEKETPRHAGKFYNDKVISKWGDGVTHIWKHGLWEVPSDYGDTVHVFRPLSEEQAVEAYIEWARAQC